MHEHPIILGRHHSHETPLMLWPADRERHFYCVGKTGMGKSTLQLNMIMQDLRLGHGVCLIDPHGKAAEDVLRHMPGRRAEDLVYFNPADPTHSVGLNPLDTPEHQRELAASHVVSIFHSQWADSWGPSLEEILGNSVAALMYIPGASFLCIGRLLADRDYRSRVVARVEDPTVRFFWEKRFGSWSQSQREIKTEPVLNKVGQFLKSPAVRHIFAQPRSTFDLRFMMDNQKVLIANLASGAIGQDKSNLIGAFLISKIFLTALSRINVCEEASEETRARTLEDYPNFYLHVDEFQNFSTSSFEAILSQARKFKLPISLAHQYIDQLAPDVQKAVFGNVGSLAVFRVGRPDAERLAPELDCEEQVVPGHLTGLFSHEAYVKLLAGGEERQATRMRTFAPYASGSKDRRFKRIRRSRERFALERTEIEARITRWFANSAKTRAKKPRRAAPPSPPDSPKPTCPYCDERGRLFLRKREGSVLAVPCPHDAVRIGFLEETQGVRRI